MTQPLLPRDYDFQKHIPLWTLNASKDCICREFKFSDFKQAFAFMTLCAGYADEIDHHPDWSNSWNKVTVQLTTHSSQGLTGLDVQIAQAMDAFALQV